MRSLTVAVSTPSYVRTDWCLRLAQAGHVILACALHSAMPHQRPDLWVVALDARHQPQRLSFWLQQLPVPLLLITPHLTAAELLCPRVPNLCLICHPLAAIDDLSAVVELAQAIRCGTVILHHE